MPLTWSMRVRLFWRSLANEVKRRVVRPDPALAAALGNDLAAARQLLERKMHAGGRIERARFRFWLACAELAGGDVPRADALSRVLVDETQDAAALLLRRMVERRLGPEVPPFRAGQESFVESLLEAWRACGWPALDDSPLLPREQAFAALGRLEIAGLDALPPEDVLVVLGCRELPLFHLSRLPPALVGRCVELANGAPTLGHGLFALSLLEYRPGHDPVRRAAVAALERHLSDLHPTDLWLRLRRQHAALVRMDVPLTRDELLLLTDITEGSSVEPLAPAVFETVLDVMQRVRSPVAAHLAYTAALYALPSDVLLPLLSRFIMMSSAVPEHRQAAGVVARFASICAGSPYLVLRFAAVHVWGVAATLAPDRYATLAAEAKAGLEELERLRLFGERRASALFRWPIARLHQEVAIQMLADEADWLDHLSRRIEA